MKLKDFYQLSNESKKKKKITINKKNMLTSIKIKKENEKQNECKCINM